MSLKIIKNRFEKGEEPDLLTENVRSMIDPQKMTTLLTEVSTGINNSVLFRKFPGFSWPLWMSGNVKDGNATSVVCASPVLLNTTNRNWQILTNYLSDGELRVDCSGMITGPGDSAWSVEFWIYSKNVLYRPVEHIREINASRNTSTGELAIRGDFRGISFIERITGGKSNINEAVVSYTASSRADMTGSMLIVTLRPYNTESIGCLRSVEYVSSGNLVKLNGKAHIASGRRPDRIITGSGLSGDITPELFGEGGSFSSDCPSSMAVMGLVFDLGGTTTTNTFRISLDREKDLSPGFPVKYDDSAKDFAALYSMRSGEGIRVELPYERYADVINQARLTMLNINSKDYLPVDYRKAADSYFFAYGLIRAGQLRDAENMVGQMISGLQVNVKKKDFASAVSAAYIVSSFNELYMHKRDSAYLQENFPAIRKIGDYVYSFCTEVHSIASLRSGTARHNLIGEASEQDIFVFYLAMSAMAYLSRCMGIFGHESRFRNEAERLQSVVRDSFDKKRSAPVLHGYNFSGLLAFPERLYLAPGEEEYAKLFRNLFVSDDFPVIDRIYGVDMFSGFSVLNQMLAIRDGRIFEFLDKLLGYTDDFFTLPEYVNPVTGRGSWGSGNSKVLASLLFSVMRNIFFIESADRLELFPVPDERFFVTGRRIRIENAPSRFGMLSFTVDNADREVRITFDGLPKYVPADIRINLPFDTKILEGDDFILKKKVNNTYFINGWPSAVRFQVAGKTSAG